MKKFILLLLLAAVVSAAYAPALRNGFVWDDTALVLRDPLIRSWRLIPEGFQHFLFVDATASDFYRPLQRLSFTLDYAAFAFQPAGYHFTSVACHIAAVLALYFLAVELLAGFSVTGRSGQFVPFLVALAWGLHPLHTSAVAYVSGRADPLAAAFGFLGLYLGLRSLRAVGPKRWSLLVGAAVAFLGSALSKEAGLIFPVLWLVILGLRKNWPALRPATVAALFVAVSYLALRLPAEHFPAPSIKTPAPLLARPIIAARALAEYAGLIVLPLQLRMERDVETQPHGMDHGGMTTAAWKELQTLAGILLFSAFVYWLNRERKRDRAVFTCLVLTLVSYLPVSGVVPLNATLAEHWLYVPSAFLFLALGLGAARFLSSPRPLGRALVLVGASVWLLFCAGRTFTRTLDWRDQRTFLERTIANGGDSVRMLTNLGGLEMSEGNLAAAKERLTAAAQREPENPFAVINLAAVAVKQNDFPAAHALLARAREMPIVAAQAHEMSAVLESKETGHTNIIRMRLASRTGAPNWAIEKRYVKLLDETGDLRAAIVELRHCLNAQWDRADSWQLLAELETKAGRAAEAQEALVEAHRYDVHLAAEQPPTGPH